MQCKAYFDWKLYETHTKNSHTPNTHTHLQILTLTHTHQCINSFTLPLLSLPLPPFSPLHLFSHFQGFFPGDFDDSVEFFSLPHALTCSIFLTVYYILFRTLSSYQPHRAHFFLYPAFLYPAAQLKSSFQWICKMQGFVRCAYSP